MGAKNRNDRKDLVQQVNDQRAENTTLKRPKTLAIVHNEVKSNVYTVYVHIIS